VWGELEATYTFIATYRPELLQQLYQVATKARHESTPAQRTLSEAMQGNQNAREDKNSPDDGKGCFVEPEHYGNSSRYRIARLKRDFPDIADALGRGEYPSVRAAAKAAGFVRGTHLKSPGRRFPEIHDKPSYSRKGRRTPFPYVFALAPHRAQIGAGEQLPAPFASRSTPRLAGFCASFVSKDKQPQRSPARASIGTTDAQKRETVSEGGLIWCGNLLPHLSQRRWHSVSLEYLQDSLSCPVNVRDCLC
jgi:hypothetical protein